MNLPEILAAHKKWLLGEHSGIRANLYDADLSGANLWATIGNMREVKSLQIDTWPVTYTADIMQIGCQCHSIDLWRKSDPRWIAAMDSKASEWWAKFGPTILALIDMSPAVPSNCEISKP